MPIHAPHPPRRAPGPRLSDLSGHSRPAPRRSAHSRGTSTARHPAALIAHTDPARASPDRLTDPNAPLALLTDDPVLGRRRGSTADECRGIVAFTFDDGPNPETTPTVIDALEHVRHPGHVLHRHAQAARPARRQGARRPRARARRALSRRQSLGDPQAAQARRRRHRHARDRRLVPHAREAKPSARSGCSARPTAR